MNLKENKKEIGIGIGILAVTSLLVANGFPVVFVVFGGLVALGITFREELVAFVNKAKDKVGTTTEPYADKAEDFKDNVEEKAKTLGEKAKTKATELKNKFLG